jgi:hypothetical protein
MRDNERGYHHIWVPHLHVEVVAVARTTPLHIVDIVVQEEVVKRVKQVRETHPHQISFVLRFLARIRNQKISKQPAVRQINSPRGNIIKKGLSGEKAFNGSVPKIPLMHSDFLAHFWLLGEAVLQSKERHLDENFHGFDIVHFLQRYHRCLAWEDLIIVPEVQDIVTASVICLVIDFHIVSEKV